MNQQVFESAVSLALANPFLTENERIDLHLLDGELSEREWAVIEYGLTSDDVDNANDKYCDAVEKLQAITDSLKTRSMIGVEMAQEVVQID